MKHTCRHIGILRVFIFFSFFFSFFFIFFHFFFLFFHFFSFFFHFFFIFFHFFSFCVPLLEPFSGLLGFMVMQNQAAHGQAPGRLQAGPSRQHPVDFKMMETLLSHSQQSPTAQAA